MNEDLKFYSKTERPWNSKRLTNAAIIGHTTETSTRLWVRAWEEDKGQEDAPDDDLDRYWLMVTEEPIDTQLQPRIHRNGGERRVLLGDQEVSTVSLKWISLKFATDLTGVVEIDNLQPGKRYFYALFADFDRTQRWEIGDTAKHSFRTVPRDQNRVSFGVFSCHQPFKDGATLRSEMWRGLHQALAASDAAFVIGCGDQVYVDGVPTANIWEWLQKVKDDPALKDLKFRAECMDSWYRDIYRGFWGHQDMRRVLARFPTYMTWDDHEIMDGWGSYSRSERIRAKLAKHPTAAESRYYQGLMDSMFAAAQRIYDEYEHSRNPKTPEGEWDYAFSAGPVATYVLDSRGHRDFEGKAGERILGAEQFLRFSQWLEGPVAKQAGLVCVVASVPLLHHRAWLVNKFDKGRLKDDLRDQWEHSSHQAERLKLLDVVAEFSAKESTRVVFLSGDVHMSGAFRFRSKRFSTARVYQLTSSGITYSGSARVPSIPIIGNAMGDYVVPQEGYVAATQEKWSFERIQEVIETQNFALLHYNAEPDGRVRIFWDLYGAKAGVADSVVRYPSLEIG